MTCAPRSRPWWAWPIASAIRTLDQEFPVSLVFTGKQTIDGDTAQVGPGIANRESRSAI